jgi:hypothetical protein
MVGQTVNNEFERLRKETIVAYFKAPSENLPGGAEENCERGQLG